MSRDGADILDINYYGGFERKLPLRPGVRPNIDLSDQSNLARLSEFSVICWERQENLQRPVVQLGDDVVSKQALFQILPILMDASDDVLCRFVSSFAFSKPFSAVFSKHVNDIELVQLVKNLGYMQGNPFWDQSVQKVIDHGAEVRADGLGFNSSIFLELLDIQEIIDMNHIYNRQKGVGALVSDVRRISPKLQS